MNFDLNHARRVVKAKVHYTSFLAASPLQLGDFPLASPQQVRNKLAAGEVRGNVCNGFWALVCSLDHEADAT